MTSRPRGSPFSGDAGIVDSMSPAMKGPTWHRVVVLAVVLVAPVASGVIVLAPAELPPGSRVTPGGMRPAPGGAHPSWRPPLPLSPAMPGALAGPAFLGVLTGPATPQIRGVVPGSPAAEAGLQAGDVILAVGGRPVHRGADLQDRIQRYRAGDEVSLRIARQGRPLELRVRLGARPPGE
jgi:membrane-associated protease RseP (regulator of RpoE activity)